MKKLFTTLMLVFATFAFLASAESDSKTGSASVHLSRESQVGTVVIPAGDYKVKLHREPEGQVVLRMTSQAGKIIDLSVSEQQSAKQTNNGQVYNFAGTTRVLSKIWFKGESRVYNVSDTAVASK
jgi:hypothetical protein